MSASDRHSFHDASASLPDGRGGVTWTFEAVEDRLVAAMDVLLRGQDREQAWLRTATMSLWRQIKSDDSEAAVDDRPIVTCKHTRAQVAAADEALGWIVAAVPSGDTRRVVGVVLVQLVRNDGQRVEWPKVWRRMGGRDGGWTTDGLRMRYGRAITSICVMLGKAKS